MSIDKLKKISKHDQPLMGESWADLILEVVKLREAIRGYFNDKTSDMELFELLPENQKN